MRRAEIPAGLLAARRAEIARIPDRVLAKMTRAELANRLVAAGEFRRRASVPHLDGDLYRYRIGLASEVLTTDDARRAGELLKTAGVVASYSPEQLAEMVRAGTAVKLSDSHIAAVGTVRDLRYWLTYAVGAYGKGTPEDSAALRALLTKRAAALGVPQLIPAGWGRPAAAASVKSTRPAAPGTLRKDTAAISADAGQQATIEHLANVAMTAVQGHAAGLGLQIDQVALQLRGIHGTLASVTGDALAKAARYDRKAARVTDPELSRGYRELARSEREKAGTA